MHLAVDEMAEEKTFKGYGPDGYGYNFLIQKIIEFDYKARGVEICEDEIFISDGAKSDTANIQEIFGLDNKIALTDPVYPVYVDSNVMAGRSGNMIAIRENGPNIHICPVIQKINLYPNYHKVKLI